MEHDSAERRHHVGFPGLRFSRWQCDECGYITILDDGSRCGGCGTLIDTDNNYVARRIAAYSYDITLLKQKILGRTELLPPSRGPRMPESEYLAWIRTNALKPMRDWPLELNQILQSGSWDSPESMETRCKWSDAQAFCENVFDRIGRLALTPPPPFFLSAHRTIIQIALKFETAAVDIISVLVARTIDDGLNIAHGAERILADVSTSASSFTRALNLLRPMVRAGRLKLSFDDALIAGTVNILDIFPEVAALAKSDPVMLEPLRCQVTAAALMQDPVRRARRIEAAHAVLASADAVRAGWVSDATCLAAEMQVAWRQLSRQHDRLVRELTSDDNPYLVDSVLDVFSKLCEGPLRRFGSIIAIASQIEGSGSLVLNRESLFEMRKLTTVYRRITASAPSLLLGVDRLLRNAEAHYDYTVMASVIKLNHLPPNAHSANDTATDELTCDDVIEQTANLLESCLAIVLALLLWASLHEDSQIRDTFRGSWMQPA